VGHGSLEREYPGKIMHGTAGILHLLHHEVNAGMVIRTYNLCSII
jgi:hypothetical protein